MAPAVNASIDAATPMSSSVRNLPRIVFMQFLPFGLEVEIVTQVESLSL
jgi:hypothetical protein